MLHSSDKEQMNVLWEIMVLKRNHILLQEIVFPTWSLLNIKMFWLKTTGTASSKQTSITTTNPNSAPHLRFLRAADGSSHAAATLRVRLKTSYDSQKKKTACYWRGLNSKSWSDIRHFHIIQCGTTAKVARQPALPYYGMMVLWKWSGPRPPTATAVASANDVLKEGMAVNAWVKELFHPVHFSQRVGHAAARPPRSLMCEWKETRSSKTDSRISFLFLLKSTCIYFVFSLLSDRLDFFFFFFPFVFSNRQQMCWFAAGSASTPSTVDRCLTQQLNRRKVGRAGSVKAERPPRFLTQPSQTAIRALHTLHNAVHLLPARISDRSECDTI